MSVTRSPTLAPMASANPLPMKITSPIIGSQESPGNDILRSNIRLRLLLGFNADDAHRESPFRAGDQPAGIDAARGYLDQGIGFSGIHHRLVICQRQQRRLVGFSAVAQSMDLDVASQDFDSVAINRLVKPTIRPSYIIIIDNVRPIARIMISVRRRWRQTLRQARRRYNLMFGIPFYKALALLFPKTEQNQIACASPWTTGVVSGRTNHASSVSASMRLIDPLGVPNTRSNASL